MTTALQEGVSDGVTADGYRWRVAIARAGDDEGRRSAPARLAGYWVSVRVDWQGGTGLAGRTVSLRTLKIWVPR